MLVTKLLVTKLLVTKLLVTKLLVTKFLVTKNPPIQMQLRSSEVKNGFQNGIRTPEID